MKCMRKDCKNEAKWQVGFRAWAVITPKLLRDKTNCLNGLMGLAVCDTCKPNVTKDVFTFGAKKIDQQLAIRSAMAPDWETAELIFIELKDGKMVMPKSEPATTVH